jgi:hypothetical protein
MQPYWPHRFGKGTKGGGMMSFSKRLWQNSDACARIPLPCCIAEAKDGQSTPGLYLPAESTMSATNRKREECQGRSKLNAATTRCALTPVVFSAT